jgi:hypothetical protein
MPNINEKFHKKQWISVTDLSLVVYPVPASLALPQVCHQYPTNIITVSPKLPMPENR